MSEPYLAEIRLFAGTFAPRGWAFCNGQLLPISQYSALFSLIGTTYGGDGRTTFALPDLRGRVPIHPGAGLGLTERRAGEMGGEERHTLDVREMPAHDHVARGSGATGDQRSPEAHVWAANGWMRGPYTGRAPNAVMGEGAIGAQGGGEAHNNLPPFLGVHYIIALQGIYPSRS